MPPGSILCPGAVWPQTPRSLPGFSDLAAANLYQADLQAISCSQYLGGWWEGGAASCFSLQRSGPLFVRSAWMAAITQASQDHTALTTWEEVTTGRIYGT